MNKRKIRSKIKSLNQNRAFFLAIFCISLNLIFNKISFASSKKIDHFVLAMSHQNEFCASHPQKKECQQTLPAGLIALHGLWPNALSGESKNNRNNLQYCSDIKEHDLGKNWCNPALDVRDKMQKKTFEDLSAIMPGVHSCLYNHEWYAHGTCSGWEVDEYFQISQELAVRFKKLENFTRLISERVGQTVTLQEMFKAIEKDLGETAFDSIRILCEKNPSTHLQSFSEIRITLNKKYLQTFPDSKSLQKNQMVNPSTCPEKDIYIASLRSLN